jgi:hypothetical protein
MYHSGPSEPWPPCCTLIPPTLFPLWREQGALPLAGQWPITGEDDRGEDAKVDSQESL